ncbi:MAG: hypothetical protein ACRDPW_10915 [Mycobacteriales bacterium]
MSNLQVKDIPAAMHEELRQRAHGAGVSIRDYVLRLIESDQATPSKAEWFRRLQQVQSVPLGQSAADLVRASRDDRDRELEARSFRGGTEP